MNDINDSDERAEQGASGVDTEAATRLGDAVVDETGPDDAAEVGARSLAETPIETAEEESSGQAAHSPAHSPSVPAVEPPPRARIEKGTILFGEYEILGSLGAGGMGEVYRARHRHLGESRAIKMMHAELSGKKGANELFLREAKALLAVRHAGVVHCHDLLSDELGRVYLIMEMIEGISLSEKMESGPLPADDVIVLGARIAAGLAAAHDCGVVHRDVSPDNIVLPGGDVAQAKLIDFGIAKLLQEGQGTIVDGFKGKLSYASPEQLGFFGGRVDGSSDFYSLGLVLCAAALGHPLGMGRTVVEAVDARREFQHAPEEIPVGLRSTIEPLLALNPADRPQHVERLFLAPGREQAGLDALRERHPGGRHPGSTTALSLGGRHGAMLIAAVALTALLLGGGSFLLRGGLREAPSAPERSAAPSAAGAQRSGERAQTRPSEPTETNESKPETPPERRSQDQGANRKRKVVSALDQVRIVGLLRGAEVALAENRLQNPKGDNAYEKYRLVLAIEPSNRTARRGLEHVAQRYLLLVKEALASGRIEQAHAYLDRASSIAPDHPGLGEARAALANGDSR